MNSTAIIRFILLLGFAVLITAVYYSPNNRDQNDDDTGESSIEFQVSRHRRAITSTIRRCKLNQYYDNEEGRCLGVPGGGKVIHINNGESCGVNLLKPHCTSSSYYFICKRDKTILAQCANQQLFNNRLQRCVYHDPNQAKPGIIQPMYHYYNYIRVPSCRRSGRFPIPGHCSLFYVCDSNGHRLFQSVFKCPQNTGYVADKGTCATVPGCEDDDTVEATICVPDITDKDVQFPSANKTTEENIDKSPGTLDESTIANVSNPTMETIGTPKLEENRDEKPTIPNDNPINVIDNPLSVNIDEDNYDRRNNASNGNVNSLFTPPVQNVSFSTNTQLSPEPTIYIPLNKTDKPFSSSEITTLSQNPLPPFDESNSMVTQVPSLISDEEYKNDTTSQDFMRTDINPVTENALIGPTQTYIYDPDLIPQTNDTSQFESITQMMTTSTIKYNNDMYFTTSVPLTEVDCATNINADLNDNNNTTNTTPVISISNTSSNLNNKAQSTITKQYTSENKSEAQPESNIEMINKNLASTVSDIPEFSSNGNVSSKLDDVTQSINVKEYISWLTKSTTPLPNLNTDAMYENATPTSNIISKSVSDVTLKSINNVTPKSVEGTQDVTMELYTSNDKTTITSKDNINSINQTSTSTPINNISFSIKDMLFNREIQNMTTKQYTNYEQTTAVPSPNIDAIEENPIPTRSDISEFVSFSDVTPQLVGGVRNVTTEQYTNNEKTTTTPQYYTDPINQIPTSTPVNEISSSIRDILFNSETQNMTTKQYIDYEQTTTISSSNIETIEGNPIPIMNNASEFIAVSDVTPKLFEGTQTTTTDQYIDDRTTTIIPKYYNDLINQTSTSAPINDVSFSIKNTLFSSGTQNTTTKQYINYEQTTVVPNPKTVIDANDRNLTSTVSNIPEFVSINDTSTTLGIGTTQNMVTKEYTTDKKTTATMFLTSIAPIKLPDTSNIDRVTQDNKNNTNAPSHISPLYQDAPVTNRYTPCTAS